MSDSECVSDYSNDILSNNRFEALSKENKEKNGGDVFTQNIDLDSSQWTKVINGKKRQRISSSSQSGNNGNNGLCNKYILQDYSQLPVDDKKNCQSCSVR